jgi:hypothetical protein
MTNSWTMLYDEILKMDENTNSNLNSTEGNRTTWIAGTDDHNFYLNSDPDAIYASSTPWKYNEEEIVKELLEYIRGTYNKHYAANDQNLQTLDFIEAAHNDGEACCRDNIMKYVSRYDKKGTARLDIMKVLHYAVLLMYFNDKNAKRETYPQ